MGIILVLKIVATILYGSLVLRLAGRKSIAQMTIAHTVVMLAIGTVLIEPLVGTDLPNTFFVIGVTVATLIIIEYFEIHSPWLKKIFTGEPVLLIEHGRIKQENLKRVRMTVQQLEMELRQAGIANPQEVKYATIEPNGHFGFLLREEFQPLTKREYLEMIRRLEAVEHVLGLKKTARPAAEHDSAADVFEKVMRADLRKN